MRAKRPHFNDFCVPLNEWDKAGTRAGQGQTRFGSQILGFELGGSKSPARREEVKGRVKTLKNEKADNRQLLIAYR